MGILWTCDGRAVFEYGIVEFFFLGVWMWMSMGVVMSSEVGNQPPVVSWDLDFLSLTGRFHLQLVIRCRPRY